MHFSKKSILNPYFALKSMHYFILSGEAPSSGKKKCILFLLQSPSGMHFSKKSIPNPHFTPKSMHYFILSGEAPSSGKKKCILFLLQSPSGMHFSKKSIPNPHFALRSMHLFYSAWQSPWFKKKELVATAPRVTREFLTTTKAVEGTNNLSTAFPYFKLLRHTVCFLL